MDLSNFSQSVHFLSGITKDPYRAPVMLHVTSGERYRDDKIQYILSVLRTVENIENGKKQLSMRASLRKHILARCNNSNLDRYIFVVLHLRNFMHKSKVIGSITALVVINVIHSR